MTEKKQLNLAPILWQLFLVSQFALLFLVFVLGKEPNTDAEGTLLPVFLSIGVAEAIFAVILSQLARSDAFLARVEPEKRLGLQQTLIIIGFVCAESVCILGFLLSQLEGLNWSAVGPFFAIGIVAHLVSYPRSA